MTEQLDTDHKPAQEGQTDLEKQTEVLPDGQDKEKPFKLDKEQEQYFGSWMGRLIKKQIEESIVPLVNQRPAYQPPSDSTDVLKKFNEEVSEQLFTDPVAAIQKVMRAIDESKTQLTRSQTVQVDKAITSFSEDPLYKDIYQDVKAIAHERAGKGYPADAAADYAFTKAKLNYMEKKSSPDGGGFDLSDGGRSIRTTKTPKLPQEFKKAAARDIAKGLFKNEAEYIAGLSPAIRAKYDF